MNSRLEVGHLHGKDRLWLRGDEVVGSYENSVRGVEKCVVSVKRVIVVPVTWRHGDTSRKVPSDGICAFRPIADSLLK